MAHRFALLLVFAAASFAVDLNGSWTGPFGMFQPDGSVQTTGTVHLTLKVSGQSLTGTAGPSESEQHEIRNGKLDGSRVTFETPVHPGLVLRFDLTFDNDTLKGTAESLPGNLQLRARVELKRKAAAADDRAADREAVRAHIDRIFQAFIKKDKADLQATHAANWLGYLEGSRQMLRGVGEYMDYTAWFDPKSPYGMTGYKMREFDMIFHGDAAFVAFVADVDSNTPGGPLRRTLRITDFYTKTNGAWIQSGSNTDLHAETIEQQRQTPRRLSDDEKKKLLTAREAVWRAWFDGDRKALEALLPEELLAVDANGEWSNRKAVLEQSAQFAASGGKLVRLEFPKTEMQVYDDTAIVYSSYIYELEQGGNRSTSSGRVTEVFVNRNGQWVNPGWHMDAMK
jgi:ketosteroid isomerase-like protein